MTAPVRHCGDETEHAAHEWSIEPERFTCVGTTAEGAAIARRLRFSGGFVDLRPPPPIEWGSTMCRRKRCVELAAVAIDGEPYCIMHGDDEIERACVEPEFARLLPELDE